MEKRTTFKDLFAQGPVLAPCVFDCVSARIVQRAGFKAMCLSGGELAASRYGYPDIGLVSLEELVSVVNSISECVPDLPMIVDIDTGFGNEINTIRTCRRVAKAGAMAVHLEDQTFPKRCGHLRGKEVIPAEDYFHKIEAAHYALEGTDCLLIARTDAINIHGLDEAIYRCNEAIKHGADIAFVEGARTVEEIEEIAKRVPGWKMYGMASGGSSPKTTYDQLTKLGYNLLTMHFTMAGSIMGQEEFARECFKRKDDIYVTDCDRVDSSPMYLFEMMGIKEWLGLGQRFSGKKEEIKQFAVQK